MMTQVQTDQVQTVTCYRCGNAILPGEGRYNVLPDESYCSFECLRQYLPHIAEALAQFTREPRQVH